MLFVPSWLTDLFFPAVSVANGDHGAEDVVPRLRFHQGFVREHAAIPANVVEAAMRLAIFTAQPVAGVFHDVDLAVGCFGQAMASGFVVTTGAEDFTIVLCNMEVDRPWPQCFREPLVARVESGCVAPLEVG